MAAPQDHDQTLIGAGGAAAAVIEWNERILGAFEERARDRLTALLTRLGLAVLDARESRRHA